MARQHVSLPADLAAEVSQLCTQFSMNKSKFIRRGVVLAIAEFRQRIASGANIMTPVSSLQPGKGPTARVIVHDEENLSTLRRGDTTWFDLDEVCNVLSIEPSALKAEIDPDDDILVYQGKSWIDHRGLAEARTLCRDHEVADSLITWSKTKL